MQKRCAFKKGGHQISQEVLLLEWAGLVAVMILLVYSSYPEKVKKLERKVRMLEKKQKGESEMSKLLTDLVGKSCKITNEDGSQPGWLFTVLDTDDEWVKLTYTDKKGILRTEIRRIDSIKKIDLTAE